MFNVASCWTPRVQDTLNAPLLQNTFVGRYILGRDDPSFNAYQKVLANSHLLKGWIGLLGGDPSSLLHASTSFQGNLIFGIKKEKGEEEAEAEKVEN